MEILDEDDVVKTCEIAPSLVHEEVYWNKWKRGKLKTLKETLFLLQIFVGNANL